jgi:cytochrome P450
VDAKIELREIPRVASGLSLAAMRRDPLRFLTDETARAGDVFQYELGGYHAVFLGHPAYVRHVLQTNARNYVKTGTPDLMMLEPMLGRGLMTADGNEWSEQRRMVQPAFHRERIEPLVPMVAGFAAAMCDSWTETIDVEAEMSRLTLRVIAKALFGFDLGATAIDFSGAVATMNEYMAHFDPGDDRRRRAFRGAKETVAAITQEILDDRRSRGSAGDDMLAMLIDARRADGRALTDREIRDQIFTFLMAGHETTAKALTWTFYLLHAHPETRTRLREEGRAAFGSAGGPAAGVAALARLELTWSVVQEAMRLYPPVWLMSRMAANDDVIEGYPIGKGTLVVISPYVLHRDARFWPDPERFDPDRFSPARMPHPPEYVYFPFSGGPRACIGRRIAALETTVVLATVASRFELDLVEGHPVEAEALVTLRPKYGMPMNVRRVG